MSAKPQASIKDRISAYLQASADKAFLRQEFGQFGAYQQVGQALRGLVGEGTLVRVGYGLYAKARPSSISGRPVPVDTLQNLALDIMKKLGIEANVGKDARALLDGLSTQVPMLPIISIGNSRVRRKIGFGNKWVEYEAD